MTISHTSTYANGTVPLIAWHLLYTFIRKMFGEWTGHHQCCNILKLQTFWNKNLEVITNTRIPTWFQCGNHWFPSFLRGVTAAAQEKASLQELQVCRKYRKTLDASVGWGRFKIQMSFLVSSFFIEREGFLNGPIFRWEKSNISSHTLNRTRPCFLRSMLIWFATWILQNTALGVQSKVCPGLGGPKHFWESWKKRNEF